MSKTEAIALRIARLSQLACILEASAEKPGNVTPTHSFRDTGYLDYLRSGLLLGQVFTGVAERSVGQLVLETVEATRREVGRNTNLGVVLLLAPLARAVLAVEREGRALGLRPGPGRREVLRQELHRVLREIDLEDARRVYRAIRLASPGGLGRGVPHDLTDETVPEVGLLVAMESAAGRDAVAREYATDYSITFSIGVRALAQVWDRLPPLAAVTYAFITLLAAVPDTLIARKEGEEMAREVSARAALVLSSGKPADLAGHPEVEELTRWLRDEENRRNPGTTADLTAASLFLFLWDRGVEEVEA